jgi:hypothetical protein
MPSLFFQIYKKYSGFLLLNLAFFNYKFVAKKNINDFATKSEENLYKLVTINNECIYFFLKITTKAWKKYIQAESKMLFHTNYS